MNQKKATIFDIERFGTKDGPGIRTVIFFKGCNLTCAWCQNPESQAIKPEIMYYMNTCTRCLRCVKVCPENAITEHQKFGYITDQAKCSLCGECIRNCFYDARKMIGKYYTVNELMHEIRKDKPYYDDSGGGVTFSGGEPLLQNEFLWEVAKQCKSESIHTALETAGHVRWEIIHSLLPYIDLMYYDFKVFEKSLHERYTGVDNGTILENLKKLSNSSENLVVRIPIIPGINNTVDELHPMFGFLQNHTQVKHVELLPYHRLGVAKYNGLGREYAMGNVLSLSKQDCKPFKELGSDYGMMVTIGAQ